VQVAGQGRSRFKPEQKFVSQELKPGKYKGGTILFAGVTIEQAQYLDLEKLASAALAID
jgi:arylsulfatase